MIGKWARAAVSALAVSSVVLAAGVPVVGVALAQGAAPPASASAAVKAAWAKAAVVQLVIAAGNNGNALKTSLAALLLANPGLAGDLTLAIIDVAENGAEGVVANASLTEALADGVAIAVAQWQSTSANSPAASAALGSVNAAFETAGVSRGSEFGARFTATLNLAGGVLLPPVLADQDSPLAVVIPFLQQDSNDEISRNT